MDGLKCAHHNRAGIIFPSREGNVFKRKKTKHVNIKQTLKTKRSLLSCFGSDLHLRYSEHISDGHLPVRATVCPPPQATCVTGSLMLFTL